MSTTFAPDISQGSFALETPVDAFTITQRYIDDAAGVLKLDPAIHALLREPCREMHASLPLRLDDGRLRVFKAYRVHYNSARGPCKGGVRIHPAETPATVRALAAWNTWQAALTDLPLGGGSGAVVGDARDLSAGECGRLHAAYLREFGCMIAPEAGAVAAPEGYTREQITAWMLNEFSPGCGCEQAASHRHGTGLGRHDAAPRGTLIAVREAARVLGINLAGAPAAIQGYGTGARFVHQLAGDMLGLQVVATSDSRGAVYNPRGLDAGALSAHKRETGSVAGFRGAGPLDVAALLELPVAVLFLAGIEDQITHSNAGQVRARIVAELANRGITHEGDHILHSRGVYVIPDLLCSAGGLVASYYEMVQGAPYEDWDAARVRTCIDDPLTRAFGDVDAAFRQHGVYHRLAAYVVALGRVAESARGQCNPSHGAAQI